MPILPTGKARDRARVAGFTLIELLVVVSVIAILALGVGLGVGGVFARPADAARAVADRLTLQVQQARDAALLGRRGTGLHPRSDGWLIVHHGPEGGWQLASVPDRAVRLPLLWSVNGARVLPRLAPPQPDDAPAVVFAPDGRGTAFAVTIGDRMCQTDGWGALTCN